MDYPEHLYHYTSLETLALILENETICFNSLANVDDMEEVEASDVKKGGKIVYVSCWTDEEEEMIPLWNLYTPNMHGVRLRLPIYPFVKYHYRASEYNFKQDSEEYIDYEQLYKENKGAIAPKSPMLVKVQYTEDESLLYPQIREMNSQNALERFRSFSSMSDIDGSFSIKYKLKPLGRYKRTAWEFQKEWRYIMIITPTTLSSITTPDSTLRTQQAIINTIEFDDVKPPYDRYYLKLDKDALKQAEVVFGPRMTKAEKILAKALLAAHGLSENWRESKLRIK